MPGAHGLHLTEVRCIAGFLAVLFQLTGCSRSDTNVVQGYIEGEYVYVSSALPGELETLVVRRGDQVREGDLLFSLDSTPEKASRDEAQRRVEQARSNLEDATKGKRPSEIASIRAQLKQAQAALVLSEKEFGRQERLLRSAATAVRDLDRARLTREQDRQRVAQLEDDLITAQLGSRIDQIQAAQANVSALEAALEMAEWSLSQKRRTAPETGLVYDTLYREGEWVLAGRPIVSLLPPQNVKVRTFVPETRITAIHLGDPLQITIDGLPEPLRAKVSFISPHAEFTPPVIYSRENRSKLVFMIEAVFDPKIATELHPGQPVDVRFGL